MPGDRKASGERKNSGESDVVSEMNEISIPLAHAVVFLDDEALVFTINVPPNVAKHSEFKFRCADPAELRRWHCALATVAISSASVEASEMAFQSLKLGSSSADFVLPDECRSCVDDLKSRSLPAECDVRNFFDPFLVCFCDCSVRTHVRQASSSRVTPLNRPKSTSDVPLTLESVDSFR